MNDSLQAELQAIADSTAEQLKNAGIYFHGDAWGRFTDSASPERVHAIADERKPILCSMDRALGSNALKAGHFEGFQVEFEGHVRAYSPSAWLV